jgi:hypothetical protein
MLHILIITVTAAELVALFTVVFEKWESKASTQRLVSIPRQRKAA